MHELSLAEELVGRLEEAALGERAGRIVEIRLELGALCGVDRDAFEFAFPEVARGTMADGARLVIDEVPVAVRCRACGKSSEPEIPLFRCLVCNAADVEIVAGRDFRVLSMEVC